jgi:enoyl-CoA hydratase/carnithine racemase
MTDGTSHSPWTAENEGEVWTLWLDEPERSQNVLDTAALRGLDELLGQIEQEASCRGLVLRSRKPGGFCAGADLKTIRNASDATEMAAYLGGGSKVIERLAGLAVPTVAVLHGVCLGGGLELALACRSRVALASSVPLQIGCPEIRFGLIPAWGAIMRLPRLINPRDALNLLLSGNPLGFLQAKSQGLVDRLVSQDEPGRILDVLRRDSTEAKPVDPDQWEAELEFAAVKLADHPTDFPDVQRIILDLIRIDLAQGADIARAAAIERCIQLALEPSTREAIDDFFSRRAAMSGDRSTISPQG